MKTVMARLGIAIVVMLAASASGALGALADTTGACAASAAGSDCTVVETVIPFATADGTPIEAQVNVARDNMFGGTAFTVEYSIQDQVDCGNGIVGDRLFRGLASGDGTMTVDARLAGAHAAGAVTGLEQTYDSCTDTWTDGAAIAFSLVIDVSATGRASTTRSTTVVKNPDGTKAIQSREDTLRTAAGTETIDGGAPVATLNGSIARHIVKVR